MPITPGSLSVAAPIQGLLTPTTLRLRRIDQLAAAPPLDLTILMPCLNEARTLPICIDKAHGFLRRAGIVGEVLIADNGSTDGSQALARRHGARVIEVPEKGYGSALISGIRAAQGRFVIMGDSDDSYDFSRLDAFFVCLRADPSWSWAIVFAAESSPAPCRHCSLPRQPGPEHARAGVLPQSLRRLPLRAARICRKSSGPGPRGARHGVRQRDGGEGHLAGHRRSADNPVPRRPRPSAALRSWRDGWRISAFCCCSAHAGCSSTLAS